MIELLVLAWLSAAGVDLLDFSKKLLCSMQCHELMRMKKEREK